MFLIPPLILISGLTSVVTVLIGLSLYGLGLIMLALVIRNVRQETSRESLQRFIRWVAIDHALSAGMGLVAMTLLFNGTAVAASAPYFKELVKIGAEDLLTVGAVMGFFAVIWALVAMLLFLIGPDLSSRASYHRQMKWNFWTLLMIGVGLLMNMSTLGAFLLICAPMLWHLRHVSRMSRQSTLIWTLAIAVRRNLPLGPEVLAASDGLWGHQRLRLILLSENLDAGNSLANSLERQPGLLPLSVLMKIRMAEETNMLATTLEDCAVMYARRSEHECEILSAQQAFLLLLLPLCVLPQILGFLCYYIIPKFKKIFEDFGTELPALTVSMINLLNPNSGAFLIMFLVSLCGVVFIIELNRRDWERDWPLLNWLVPRINGPPILRCLSLLISEQRSVTSGLQGLIWSHPRKSVRRHLNYVYQSLLQGGDLANALATEKLIRRSDVPLLHAAERVRNLPWCLEQLATTMEARTWYRFRVLLEAGYPALVLAIGCVVFLVVVGFFLPLVKLLNDLS